MNIKILAQILESFDTSPLKQNPDKFLSTYSNECDSWVVKAYISTYFDKIEKILGQHLHILANGN